MKSVLLSICVCFFLPIVSFAQCWQSFSVGNNHSLIIKSDKSLWAIGRNLLGEIGDGSVVDKLVYTSIGTTKNWKQVSGGRNFSMAIATDGTLWGWGDNSSGQLGDGTTGSKLVPTQIGTDTNWRYVSAGSYHCLALKTDGSLWAWGENSRGGLGDGTIIRRLSPIQIGTDKNWTHVSSAYFNSIALKSDSSMWTWGEGGGKMGDGTTLNSSIPKKIAIANKWIAVQGAYQHTLAIEADGSLWGWGFNSYGELNDSVLVKQKLFPTRIGLDNDWQAVDVSLYFSMALKKNGTLWAWGSNSSGTIGDGTIIDKWKLTQVGLDSNWASFSVAGHVLASKTDGSLWVWGSNYFGQFGDSTTNTKLVPTKVNCTGKLSLPKDQLKLENWAIYPNPVTSILNVKNPTAILIDKIVIRDFLGRIVLMEKNSNGVINLAGLVNGLYHIQIQHGTEQQQFKLIKE